MSRRKLPEEHTAMKNFEMLRKFATIFIMVQFFLGAFMVLPFGEENTARVEATPQIVGDTMEIDGASLDPEDHRWDLIDTWRSVDFNIHITNNGILYLEDSTLEFLSDKDHRYWLNVESGGEIRMVNSVITVETDDPLIESYDRVPWFDYAGPKSAGYFWRLVPFNINVSGTGSMIDMSEGSALMYEGYLDIYDDAEAYISDSLLTSAGDPKPPFNTHDFGIVVRIGGGPGRCTAEIEDTRIEKSPWFQNIWYEAVTSNPPAGNVMMYDAHRIQNSDAWLINTTWDLVFNEEEISGRHTTGDEDNWFPDHIHENHHRLVINNSNVKFYELETIENPSINPKVDDTFLYVDDPSVVALYRWLSVTPVDAINVPVATATVIMESDEGAPLYDDVSDYNRLSLNTQAVAYLNRKYPEQTLTEVGDTTEGITGTSGRVIFLAVSDIIDQEDINSLFVGNYNLTATYPAPAETVYKDISLPHFPQILAEDNFIRVVMPPFSFIAPHPELWPEFTFPVDSPIREGETFDINVTVWNKVPSGYTGQSVTHVRVEFWSGNPEINTSKFIGNTSIPSIPDGENRTTNISWSPEAGTYTLYVLVDRDYQDPFNDNRKAELNEANNTITDTITVLTKPDLAVYTSHFYTEPAIEAMEGDTVRLNARVYNHGGSSSGNVEVKFSYGDETGPSTEIGTQTVDVPAGSSALVTYPDWVPAVQAYYLWVEVDEPRAVEELTEDNNMAGYINLTVKTKADLVTSVSLYPVSPQPENTQIKINVTVTNTGSWNVTDNIVVSIYDEWIPGGEPPELLYTTTLSKQGGISLTGAGYEDPNWKSVVIYWEAQPPGTHNISAVAESVIVEDDKDNNWGWELIDVTPRPNLAITASDITFSNPHIMNGSSTTITITVRNIGQYDIFASDEFWISIWMDEIGGSGTLITDSIMISEDIAGNSFTTTMYTWNNVAPPGLHYIYVWLDHNNTLTTESSETDNYNAEGAVIIIYKSPSDLIVNDATSYPPYPVGTCVLEHFDSSDPYLRDGFTLVEEHGILEIIDSTFKVVDQTSNYEFNIVVKDNGTLILREGSTLTTEGYMLNIYLYDDASLIVTDSTLETYINIIAHDNAYIEIEESTVKGDIYAEDPGSAIRIEVINSTLTSTMYYIKANTVMNITNGQVGGKWADDTVIFPEDNAIVYVWWWLKAIAHDVNDMPIDSADVTWYRSPPWKDSGSGQTDADGEAYFRLRGMNITAEGAVIDIGSYFLRADYTYGPGTYYPDETGGNQSVEMNRPKTKTIKFSSVRPELDPPLYFDPETGIGVLDSINVSTVIYNNGSNDAYEIEVWFKDNVTGGILYTETLTFLAKGGGSQLVWFTWVPTMEGYHNISVWVDPKDQIEEYDEGNNVGYQSIFVEAQKADLTVTAIQCTPTPAREKDTITVKATILNQGGREANNINVSLYYGATLLSSKTISQLIFNDDTIVTFEWSYTPLYPFIPPGIHTIKVVVDPDPPNLIQESEEGNNEMEYNLNVYRYADLIPTSISYTPTSPDDNDLIEVTAQIQNIGETIAPRPGSGESILVKIYKGPSSEGNLLGSKYITSITPGGIGEATIQFTPNTADWSDPLSEDYEIYVLVEFTPDGNPANDEHWDPSWVIHVTLRADLNIDSTDISFSDSSPYAGQTLTIWAVINNSGGTDSGTFEVQFWDGDPVSGGEILNTKLVTDIASGQEDTTDFAWNTAGEGGAHEIFVVVDSGLTVEETEENNNKASRVIVIYTENDYIVNNTLPAPDTPGEPETLSFVGGEELHSGYVLIEEEGTMILSLTLFMIQQVHEYDYNIIVKDQGKLILDNDSTLTTSGPRLRLYLYDDATLEIKTGSEIGSTIDIIASGDATIIIEESDIRGQIKVTDPEASVTLDATNSTFYQPFTTFGGYSRAYLTDVKITTSMYPSDNAILEIYKWLTVAVEDGAGGRLANATVDVTTTQGNPIVGDTSSKGTNSLGEALFRIRVNIIAASPSSPYYTIVAGKYSYNIDVTYLEGGETFTGNGKVTFDPFPDMVHNHEEVTIQIDELTPELGVTDVSVYVDGELRSIIGTLEMVEIRATIVNNGKSDLTMSQDLKVSFFDDEDRDTTMDQGESLGEKIANVFIASNGGSGTVNLTWLVKLDENLGFHHIYAYVNPDEEISETDGIYSNNKNYTSPSIEIVASPDLFISTEDINFLKDGEFTENVTQGDIVTIQVTIHCRYTDAELVTATAYDGDPSFGIEIGTSQEIALINQDGSSIATITWDTDGYSVGSHFVNIVISDQTTPKGSVVINDQTPTSVQRAIEIREKPILSLSDIQFFDRDGNEITDGTASFQDRITLSTTVENDGGTAFSVDVTFWIGEPGAGSSQIGGNVTVTIERYDNTTATLVWLVDGVQQDNTYDIYAAVNYYDWVPEDDKTDNTMSAQLLITPPVITIQLDLPDTIKVKPGEEFIVKGLATFTDTTEGYTGQVEIRILRNGNLVGSVNYATPAAANGYFLETITAPSQEGDYVVEVRVTGTNYADSTNLEVKEEVGIWDQEVFAGIPLWILLLLIIGVIIAILIVGLIIGRLGLGKLVECGECGAFIPEGEKMCPKCGTVFETDLARCSECGSWIPIKKKSCPECGAVFAGLEKEKKDYIERMKLQYVEFVDQFRPEAVKDLGKGMTHEAFKAWWKANPKYVGFEQWLQMEEEKKKGRTIACPSCGTINAMSAKICLKCGSLFGKEEEERERREKRRGGRKEAAREPAETKAAPPPAVEKKAVQPPEVVKKKVVQPPVVQKKVVKQPPVVQKKVVKRPPEE